MIRDSLDNVLRPNIARDRNPEEIEESYGSLPGDYSPKISRVNPGEVRHLLGTHRSVA
ncbi:MAG TPA: hypothetical protein PLN52_23780 [Opitutaceae bacterium]|nr:hypothetical protein [Opitutaceae bacterium]